MKMKDILDVLSNVDVKVYAHKVHNGRWNFSAYSKQAEERYSCGDEEYDFEVFFGEHDGFDSFEELCSFMERQSATKFIEVQLNRPSAYED